MFKPVYISKTNPSVNDDCLRGYIAGSFWLNSLTNTLYQCKDAARGAASWIIISSGQSSEWNTWTPSLTWGPGIPTVSKAKYRYITIGKAVYFIINLSALNETGGGLNSLEITLPITPKDTDMKIPVNCEVAVGTGSPSKNYMYIDAENDLEASRTLKTWIMSFPNSETWHYFITGFYEIS